MSCILTRGEAKMRGHLCGTMTAEEGLDPSGTWQEGAGSSSHCVIMQLQGSQCQQAWSGCGAE